MGFINSFINSFIPSFGGGAVGGGASSMGTSMAEDIAGGSGGLEQVFGNAAAQNQGGFSQVFSSPIFWSSLITGGAGLTASLYNPGNYAGSKEAFEANLALSREKLAADQAMAEAATAAQLEAAKIAADAALRRGLMEGNTQVAALKEKSLADSFAMRIQGKLGRPDLRLAAGQSLMDAMQQTGRAGQQGFQGAANLLASFRR